ncbi:hypothetical protein M0R04_08060 [Candidatus Dojkabacteria bacterium]|nr:hypothetical protein [Candidatus Dojkabacteria bacterium]
MFVRKSTEKSLYFMDGGEPNGYITFLSEEAKEPGRGSRPTMVIVDEAAHISRDVYEEISSGHSGIPKIYISTVNKDSKKNRFYEGLIRAELKQTQRKESQDELVHRLRLKYGFDKVNSIEELDYQKLMDARYEYYENRPEVGMRFTLDDVEYKSEREKQVIIEKLMRVSMSLLMSEQYSEYLDDNGIFNYDGLLDDKVPEKFDEIVFSHDQATEFDNPTLVIIGTE